MTERHEQPVAGGPLSVDNDADYLMLSAFGSAAGSITDIPVLRQHERDAAAAEACSDQPVTLVQSLPARPRYADRLVVGDAYQRCQAGAWPGAGSRPSWAMVPMVSTTPQCSAISPWSLIRTR